jgi:hypothetical protein
MTVGTTSDFNMTRNDLIKAALRKIRVFNPKQQLDGVFINTCSEALNLLVRSWQADGLHIWTQSTGAVFCVEGQSEYILGTDHACNLDDLVKTTLGADEAAGQTVITLTDTTGMTALDYIGIVQSDDSVHWTTIVTVDSSTQVTITAATTVSAVSGATVFTYTTRLGKVVKVYDDIRRRVDADQIEVPIFGISRTDYNRLTNKNSTGYVAQVYYQPERSQGRLFMWPTPTNSTDIVLFTYERDLLDFDAATDNPDLPLEWNRALVWALAAEVGAEFGIPLERQQYVESKAATLKEAVMGWDNDVYSIRVAPDWRE